MLHIIKETLKIYRNLGYVTVFSYLRFLHAPYVQTEAFVPKRGLILDLGCGYGFFPNLLALASGERDVLGLELSRRKLAYADRGVKNARFINKDITKVELNDCDAVVLVHVLHHLRSYGQHKELLAGVHKKLKTGGKLIIVEIDKKPLWKFLFTIIIDAALYAGDWFYYRSEEDFVELFRELDFKVEKIVPAHRFVPLSHKIYICRK